MSTTPTADPIVNRVIAQYAERVERGQQKYGMTLADNHEGFTARLEHAKQEMMDGAAYLEWAKDEYCRELNRRVTIEQLMLDASSGKSDMPDAKTLRLWALALGTPRELWSDKIKEAVKR